MLRSKDITIKGFSIVYILLCSIDELTFVYELIHTLTESNMLL